MIFFFSSNPLCLWGWLRFSTRWLATSFLFQFYFLFFYFNYNNSLLFFLMDQSTLLDENQLSKLVIGDNRKSPRIRGS